MEAKIYMENSPNAPSPQVQSDESVVESGVDVENPLTPPLPEENAPPPVSPHARYLPVYMSLAFAGALAIGLIIGFLTRPLIIPDHVQVVEVAATAALSIGQVAAQTNPEGDATSTETEPATQEGDNADVPSSAASPAQGTTDTEANPSASTIMDFLLANARHFQGADDAPVTIIEFSDFR
jgi:hypothetical protein